MWPGTFFLYVIVEVAAFVGVAEAIGLGWTFLAVIVAFILGLILAGSQTRRAVSQLRQGISSPGGAAADGVLIALGTVAVVMPGLVSSVIGLLLLLPPTRALLRPVLAALVVRELSRRAPIIAVIPTTARRPGAGPASPSGPQGGTGDYIEGEVISTKDDPPPSSLGRDLPA